MADELLRIGGRGDDGKAKAIRTDSSGHQYISSENSVIQRFFLSDLELRDTQIYQTETVFLHPFSKATFFVDNSTDADIRLRPRTDGIFLTYYESGEYKNTGGNLLIIPKNTRGLILNDMMPRVFDRHWINFAFSYNALTVPTTGTLTLKAIGLKK
ncbi:hypothetical protein [Bacillus sp. B15-48]|uniref:hypothetical protein n=1 Tax=Bacillus sp. B15-48 TaxID=1548601 RepID=UPI00193F89E1|nr:hypothetical protein [Bacillus sp. B15-48]MBM4762699.1 hypothetical protein [Bacillus sp. B15-48]